LECQIEQSMAHVCVIEFEKLSVTMRLSAH